MMDRAGVLFLPKIKWIVVYGFLLLILCFTVFPIGLYFYLNQQLTDAADSADQLLQHQMEEIFTELKQLTESGRDQCDKASIQTLRQSTFYSPIFKEFGLFNTNFRVYCSSIGKMDISIYASIRKRIEDSPEHRTVSLTKSHNVGEDTFFAFYLGENGIGANGLAPPRALTENIARTLLPDYHYELKIGKRVASSYVVQSVDSLLGSRVRTLEDWAMTLTVFAPQGFYLHRLIRMLPLVLSIWGGLFLLCLLVHYSLSRYRYSLNYEVKQAIKQSSMEAYFQPIISLSQKKCLDMEALVRWTSPTHGQISPLLIVKISERLGILDDLTWMMIRKVGQFYQQYFALLRDVRISVNVDRLSFLGDTFIETLSAIMIEYPELKNRLCLEVTETSVLDNQALPIMISHFERIGALGVRLSVDDFGTGYSGLDFLRRFPYDVLKLDQVFIANLQDGGFTQPILSSIIALAREFNMELVAEGVERKDQLEAVKELGIDRVQGYYFCRPVCAEKAIKWLAEYAQRPAYSKV